MATRPVRGEESEKPAEASPPPAGKITENLFKARTVILFGEITQKVAQGTVAQLLALAESECQSRGRSNAGQIPLHPGNQD